jgi:uncharacterized protein YndB with AHSA1/START domain
MKDLRLIVRINKPISEVFEFTTNPANTAKWIDSVEGEKADAYPPEIGTYRQDKRVQGYPVRAIESLSARCHTAGL